MKITVTIEDAPEGFDPHPMLREAARQFCYELPRVHSAVFTDNGVTILGEPRRPDEDKTVDF